jgi:Tfp pilus assembly protein PilF
MARANAWIARGRWADAEAAFEEAIKACPDDGRIRWERARFFARHARPKEAAEEFAESLLRNVMHDLLAAKIKSWSEADQMQTDPLADAQSARAELSQEILADRSIADRVSALVPEELFQVLHPLVRARYWADRRHWPNAETAFKQALAETSERSLEKCRVLIERGRYFAARALVDEAAQDFHDAVLSPPSEVANVAVAESAKDILANVAIRDRVFASSRRYFDEHACAHYAERLNDFEESLFERFRGQLFDAVFPEDPFVH